MRRLIFFAFPLLVLSLSAPVSGQASNKSQPPANLTRKEPARSASVVLPSSPEREAEAQRYYEEGLKLMEAEQFQQAAESFQQAIRLNSKHADAYSALGRTYFKMRQWQKAIDNLQRAAELHREVRTQEAPTQKPEVSSPAENAKLTESKVKPSQSNNTTTAMNVAPKLSPPPKTTPDNKQQAPNSNAAGSALQPNPPTLPDRQPKTAGPETKPQATNSVGGADPVRRESKPTASPERQQATVTGAAVVTPKVTSQTASQPTQPNTPQGNPPANPASSTTSQPVQQPSNTRTSGPQLNTSANAASSTTSQPVQQPTTRTNAPQLNTPANAPSSTTSQPVQQPNNTLTNTPQRNAPASPASSTTSQPVQQPNNTRTNAPQLNTPANATSSTSQPVQQPNVAINSPQGDAPANSKPTTVQSHPSQKFEKAAIASLTADTGNGLAPAPQPAGERVAMNVTPSSQPLETNTVTPAPAKPPTDDVGLTKIYRVGPNDVLDVRVNDSESPKSTLFTITPAGLLEYPLLVEPLSVTGLTVEEIGTRIEDDLKKRALIENPKVIVGVRDYGSHTIIVSGLVKDAGTKFLMREAIPLYVVVADAQPLPEAARVTLVRNDMNQVFDVDLMRAADMNLLVRPGDVLTFQPNVTQFVYIGGDVKIPGEKTFRRGLTLTQVILTAGGVTPKATLAQIARDDGRGFLAETSFKLKDISSGKTVDPILKPGDRILILR